MGGGNGYSGGGSGMSVGCDGGYNGGDGESCNGEHGGYGTGEDVTSFKLENFVLTPGARGISSNNGGGGGGVLVNGDGPDHEDEHDATGYGAGGGWTRGGLQGVILIEIINN